jgi:hypothetical protein
MTLSRGLLLLLLTDVNHPDHTLITYPIGHVLYPSPKWSRGTGVGIEQYVLADIYAWLESHSGFTHIAAPVSPSNVSSPSPDTR